MKPTRALTGLLLTLTILFAALPPSRAQGSATYTAKAPTTAAMLLVSGDAATSGVEITNNGSVTVYLGGSDVTASTGFPVFVNNRITFKSVTSPIYGITASSTGSLRIVATRGGGTTETARLATSGIANGAAANTVPMSNGSDLVAGNVLVENVTTAVTPNSTTTSDTAGSLIVTSNSTGKNSVFRSDGSKWQLLSYYSDFAQNANLGTVATTSTTDDYVVANFAATLISVDCSSTAALTANDTNYLTFTLTNLGAAGGGSTAMLAATAPNTTQATGGTGFGANTKRSLTVSGTGGNLVVAAGDRLLLRFAATGTLANTLTNTKCSLRFNRLS